MAVSARCATQAFTTNGGLKSARRTVVQRTATVCQCSAVQPSASRRSMLQQSLGAAVVLAMPLVSPLASQAVEESKILCDAECTAKLEANELVTTPSGLSYRDLVIGKGPNPVIGFQVVANYVAMTPKLRVFDSSLDRGAPYDMRVGSGQVVAGLDEGLMTMRPGGIRRLYIPGDLAFPKGLKAAAGRPAVPPKSAVVFDVQLLYIPGLDFEADEE